MNNDEIKKFCIELAKAETEDEVVEILKKSGYWEDDEAWQYYGGIEDNFGTINNQSSESDKALVEKIINSIDSVLLRECYKNRIDPESSAAPKYLKEALIKFFQIYEGKLSLIDEKLRRELSRNIALIATGIKKKPCYIVIDKGEGQTSPEFHNTFLSLHRGNKIKIPFVQGRYNMGSTGVLQFCGSHNFQLIISRKTPEIKDFYLSLKRKKNERLAREIEEFYDYWGFTVVRRFRPSKDSKIKNSVYKYLAPGNKILSFKSDSLPIAPSKYPNPYDAEFKSGTFIKLYEYNLSPPGLKTIIKLDLFYRLSILLPSIALPIILYERRDGYSKETSHYIIMPGLNTFLEENKKEIIEDGFPTSHEINVRGEKFKVSIYLFKKNNSLKKYSDKDGVFFILDGQTHATLPKTFFQRKKVSMDYLKDDILIFVDCSSISSEIREDFFMASRDRIRSNEVKQEIEDILERIVSTHDLLRKYREERKREALQEAISEKPKEIIQEIINKSPTFIDFLQKGKDIQNPFKLIKTGVSDKKYEGKFYPSYFRLKKDYPKEKPKLCFKNRKFRIQFETDVKNDYFTRDKDPGKTELFLEKNLLEKGNYNINLLNGLATLEVDSPIKKEGEIIEFSFVVKDETNPVGFVNDFYVKIEKEDLNADQPTKPGERKKPRGDNSSQDRDKPLYTDLPKIIKCRQEKVEEHFGEDKKYGVLKILKVDAGEYHFYINMENYYLLNEIKKSTESSEKLEYVYIWSIVLLAMGMIKFFDEDKNDEGLEDQIPKYLKGVVPVIFATVKLDNVEFN